MVLFKTPQEQFWHGAFGNAYTDRNDNDVISRSNLIFWGRILKQIGPIKACLELGCNRGLNLDAIKVLLPSCRTVGLEINPYAAGLCASKGHQVFQGSILVPPSEVASSDAIDLAFSSGVLIHIEPSSLKIAYELLYNVSQKFILISEYFNPEPVAIPYRGHDEKLFKRDFASELWKLFPHLRLVDYGFIWRQDPIAPKDDITWFLFEK